MDGAVTSADQSLLIGGLVNGRTGWSNGDFNYDGVVDSNDFSILLTVLRLQGAPLARGGMSDFPTLEDLMNPDYVLPEAYWITGGFEGMEGLQLPPMMRMSAGAVPEPVSGGVVWGLAMLAGWRRRGEG